MLADVHLEHVGAALRQLVDRILGAHGRRLDGMLVDHLVAPAAERQREERHDARAGPHGERRDDRRGCGGPVEEVDVNGVLARDVLVDENPDPLPVLQHPHRAANRPLAVDDAVAGARTHLLEQPVQVGVVERSGHHRHRLQPQSVHQRLQLPVAEVSGNEQHPLAVRVCGPHPLLALELHPRQQLVGGERAELQ